MAGPGGGKPRGGLLGFLQLMSVAALELMAGSKFRTAFVIFPDFVEPGFAWRASQRTFFENVSFRIAIQFEEF